MKKLLSCLIVLLLLSSCKGSVLYFDDFSDPASGWARSADSGAMDYVEGQLQVNVNEPNYDSWALSGETYRDVQVEADATPLMGSPLSRFGLICRYHDPRNFYFFIVTGDGYYGIGKVVDGVRSLIGQEMLSYSRAILQWNTQNHLRFDCKGSSLSAYANSSLIASVADTDLSRGDAGLIAGSFDQPGVVVVFDNFVVYKP